MSPENDGDEGGGRETPADVPEDAEPFIDSDGPTSGYACSGTCGWPDDGEDATEDGA